MSDRPRLTEGEEAKEQDRDELIHGFTVSRVGEDGKWHRIDPDKLRPVDRGWGQ